MTYQESLFWQDKEKAFLDTLDIICIIKENDIDTLRELMDIIEDMGTELYHEEDFVFNCMDSSEFADYLKKRYKNMLINEEVVTTYRIQII